MKGERGERAILARHHKTKGGRYMTRTMLRIGENITKKKGVFKLDDYYNGALIWSVKCNLAS